LVSTEAQKYIVMFLSIVSDEQLMTNQIVKSILLIILSGGIVLNIFRIFRNPTRNKKLLHIVLLLIISTIFYFVFNAYKIEAALLKNPQYIIGTTKGFCKTYGQSNIDFEYEINGKKFEGCNTYSPIPQSSIITNGGRYLVRYSNKYPEGGRMDFTKPAK